jgi:hypothetical protein
MDMHPVVISVSKVAAAALLASVAAACSYTTKSVVSVQPLPTIYPVSASGQYIDGRGVTVTEKDYRVLAPFTLRRSVQASPLATTESMLELAPQLDELVKAAEGDAITNMKVAATEYELGSHRVAASFKLMGWTLGLTGAGFAAVGLAIDDEKTKGAVAGGAVCAGLGLIAYLIGAAQNDPAKWHIEATGQVTRRLPSPSSSAGSNGIMSSNSEP